MIWLAALLALVLIYRLTIRLGSRRVARILVAVLAVSLVAVFAAQQYFAAQSERSGKRLTVHFDYSNTKSEVLASAAAVKVKNSEAFRQLISQNFPKLSDKEKTEVVSLLLPGLPESALIKDWDRLSQDERNALNKANELRIFGGDPWLSYIKDSIANVGFTVDDLRKKEGSIYLLAARLYRVTYDYKEEPQLNEQLKRVLDEKEWMVWQAYADARSKAAQLMYDELNQNGSLLAELSFRICNNTAQTLTSCTFSIAGLFSDRSSPQPVTSPERIWTPIASDYLIKPNSCVALSWTGKYKIFPKYSVADIAGKWEEIA